VTLVADNGVSVQGGARSSVAAVTAWKSVFSRARYVWLSVSNGRRIPWTAGLRAWFAARFRPVGPAGGGAGYGQLFLRR
jgi:hypothetical protein